MRPNGRFFQAVQDARCSGSSSSEDERSVGVPTPNSLNSNEPSDTSTGLAGCASVEPANAAPCGAPETDVATGVSLGAKTTEQSARQLRQRLFSACSEPTPQSFSVETHYVIGCAVINEQLEAAKSSSNIKFDDLSYALVALREALDIGGLSEEHVTEAIRLIALVEDLRQRHGKGPSSATSEQSQVAFIPHPPAKK